MATAVGTLSFSSIVASFRLGSRNKILEDDHETVVSLARMILGDRQELRNSQIRLGLVGRVEQIELAGEHGHAERAAHAKICRAMAIALDLQTSSGEHDMAKAIRKALASASGASGAAERAGPNPSTERAADSTPNTDPQVPRPNPNPSSGHRAAAAATRRAVIAETDRRFASDAFGTPLTPPPPPHPAQRSAPKIPPFETRHTTGPHPIYRSPKPTPPKPPPKKGEDE